MGFRYDINGVDYEKEGLKPMTGSCGRWVTLKEYAELRGVAEGLAGELSRAAGLMRKSQGGRELIWLDDPANCVPADGADAPRVEKASAEREAGPADEKDEQGLDKRPGSGGDGVVEGSPLSRFSGTQELAMQAERAISLVERSLSTFMMMHQEVVKEKERYADLSREGLGERDHKIEEKSRQIEDLEVKLREKDQELADLKMLVEILEGRVQKQSAGPPAREVSERASVGDLMEEQLRYIMEDQMIKELLKE